MLDFHRLLEQNKMTKSKNVNKSQKTQSSYLAILFCYFQ